MKSYYNQLPIQCLLYDQMTIYNINDFFILFEKIQIEKE